MSSIKVNTNELSVLSNCLNRSRNQICKINEEFLSTMKNLDWDIKSEIKILGMIGYINAQLQKAEEELYKHREFINEAIRQYEEAGRFSNNTSELKNNLYSQENENPKTNISNNNVDNKESKEKIDFKLLNTWFKELVKKGYSNTGMMGGIVTSSWVCDLLGLYGKYYDKDLGKSTVLASYVLDALGTGGSMMSTWYSNFVPEGIVEGLTGNVTSKLGSFFKYELPVVNVFTGMGVQALNSYDSLSADGEMNCSDWGELLIDTSTKGMTEILVAAATIYGGPALGAGVSFIESKLELSSRAADGFKALGKTPISELADGLLFEISHPKTWLEGLFFKGDYYSQESLDAANSWQNGSNLGEKIINSMFDSGLGKFYKNKVCEMFGVSPNSVYLRFNAAK